MIPLPGRGSTDAQPKLPPEIESARLQLCTTLQATLKPDGFPRFVTPTQKIAAFNQRSEPELVPASEIEIPSNPLSWLGLFQKDTVIGDDVIKISTMEDYNIHFPWRRGHFNLHSGPGGSLTSVLTDLEHIWGWAVVDKLGIPLKALKVNIAWNNLSMYLILKYNFF
jgi:actin-related protein 8